MNAWSQLPNAHHIDWVLASLKKNPELWDAAQGAAVDAAWNAAWAAKLDAAWNAACNAAWNAAWAAKLDAAWNAARKAAWNSMMVLIAYDDSVKFLDMTGDELEVWARLSEDPRAILLLPMVYVKERLDEQCLVTTA